MDPEIGGPMSNPHVQDAVRYALDYRGLQTIAGSGAITPNLLFKEVFLERYPQEILITRILTKQEI